MTAPAETAIAPFRLFDLRVVRARRLGPSLMRVTFGGFGDEDLSSFAAGGRDQSLSLFLPHPGQEAPVLPPTDDAEGWWGAYRSLPDDVRAVMRSYTVRAQRRDPRGGPGEIDIDFALHGDGGPACRWAGSARAGDRVTVLGPAVADNTAVRFRPPAGTDSVVIWADETALPAAAGILEWLPPGLPAQVWITAPETPDALPRATAADARVTWLSSASPLDAIREAPLPGASPYVWIAGEASQVRCLRRHFVGERGVERGRVTFVGYWRRGRTEDELRAA
ncbi:siderophore-interacting protein [Streptomyces sp. ASQP_92]|uniref:siderophore-interacting protein n=1 Tax=Streptomyces sp. ASQP_92 TaxID=2979116 RepID=UPI0021C15EB4|nr:siderophore-interacting protein [Streptomyces sp. ASQP_92]MCT9087490.1 siderophore-interacting protein [Streptomyces sp. ASQP_92]